MTCTTDRYTDIVIDGETRHRCYDFAYAQLLMTEYENKGIAFEAFMIEETRENDWEITQNLKKLRVPRTD